MLISSRSCSRTRCGRFGGRGEGGGFGGSRSGRVGWGERGEAGGESRFGGWGRQVEGQSDAFFGVEFLSVHEIDPKRDLV